MSRLQAALLALILTAASSWMLALWADDLKQVALGETRAILSRVENTTMVSWTHTLEGGGQILVEVYRRDYTTQAEYVQGIADMMELYPPDPAGTGSR